MNYGLFVRRQTSAREEEEREKPEPAKTRNALSEQRLRVTQEEKQPKVVNLEEVPAEDKLECPKGEMYRIMNTYFRIFLNEANDIFYQVAGKSFLPAVPAS